MGVTNDYIKKYSNDVVKVTAKTGLFPSVMLAQGIIESDNGRSALTSVYKNHFGIKADSGWAGKKILFDSGFYRAYKTDAEGFKDRINFLQKNPRYTTAGVFNAKTPEEQVKALIKGKYAEDPKYVSKIIKVINDFNLKQFDFKKVPDLIKKENKKLNLTALILILSSITLFIYIKNKK